MAHVIDAPETATNRCPACKDGVVEVVVQKVGPGTVKNAIGETVRREACTQCDGTGRREAVIQRK